MALYWLKPNIDLENCSVFNSDKFDIYPPLDLFFYTSLDSSS